jgi:hypothetical protein
MSFFPFNPNVTAARRMQSDVPGLYTTQVYGVKYSLTAAEAAVADVDYFVASADMKVGAYTLANTTMLGNCARNVTVTQTAVGTEDTNGTVVVNGTDLAGNAITETLTPNAGVTVAGTKAFRTVTSVTGAGWVIDGVEATKDTVTVGFGDIIGLPDLLPTNSVLVAALGGTKEAVDPAVTVSTTNLEDNTVDLASALNGSAVDIYYVV